MKLKIILIVIGALLVADTVFAAFRMNLNLGLVMPACIGAPLLIIGLLYERLAVFCAGGFGLVLKYAVIAVYAVFIVILIVCTALMLSAPKADIEDDADAVIVLGAAVHGDQMSLTLERRTRRAEEYLKLHDDAICVVSGGQGGDENIAEAQAMYNYLISAGIAPDRIIVEDKARSTRENFEFSKKLLDARLGEYTAIFVTSDEHIYRACIEARRSGLDIKGLGAKSAFYILPNLYLRETAAIVRGVFGD